MSSHRTAYVAFPTRADPSLTVAGKLRIPAATAPMGAVLICHGSDGVDGRGEFHAPALNEAGLVTLEIDMWSARCTARGAAARPSSPISTLPDAFAALAFLRAQPEVQPDRVGILGFSWGGVVSLLASAGRFAEKYGAGAPPFAAHAAHYPVCWAFLKNPAFALEDLTGAPILLQTGDADTYDTPGAGERLAERLRARGEAEIESVTYAGAGHGFDRDLPAQTINDPFAHEGAGGPVLMAFDPAAASAARSRLTSFFRRALA